MTDSLSLHDRWEGDWDAFEPRFLQDLDEASGSFTQSGFSNLEYTKGYLLRWSDWQVTATGFGGIRLNFYDASYVAITGVSYTDIYFSTLPSDGWRRNIVRLKSFKDEVGPEDYIIPSGTMYTKISIRVPQVTGVVSTRYVQELDLVEGNSYVGYTTFSGDSTFVSYKELSNGYYPGNPLLRENYEFIGQRIWKSEDASTKTNEFITFEDKGAANNTEYTYVVDAFDLNGNQSPFSEPHIIMAGDIYPPAQVTGLTAVNGPESIVLIWTAPVDTDYSHVNIYSNVGLTTLVKPEFGSPGAKDTTVIGGLIAGTPYTFYVCAVDKYGNENRTSIPSVTGTPTAFSNTEDLLITLDGDDYVRQETETFKIFSKYPLNAVPTVSGWDISNNALTIGAISLLSAGVVSLYSGSVTVGAGNTDGQARLLANGVTVSGSLAFSPFKLFLIDKTNPSISVNPVEYNYDSGTKKFYNKNSMGKFTISITDAGGANSFSYRLNSSSNSEWLPYLSGINNGSTVLLPQEGLNTIYVKGRDKANNESSESSIQVYRDSEPPIVSISGVGSNSQFGLWSNSSTTLSVKFLAKDNEVAGAGNVAGISGILWRYAYNRAPDTGDTWNITNGANPTITVPIAGSIPAGTASVQLEYYGVDYANNASEHVVETLNIDNVAPVFTAGLFGNCQPVPGGFHLVWDPTKITDAAPSSGLKQITIYRDTNSAMTTKSGIVTIGYNISGTRSFVDSSQMENYKWYWWAMEAEDNAGNKSLLSPTVSGQIGHNITGIFRNFISNGSFERIENYDTNLPEDWWKTGSPTIDKTSSPYHGTNYAIVDNNNYYYIQNFPLINAKTNQRRVFSCYAKKIGASVNLSGCITFKFYDSNKTLIQTSTKNYPLINGTWSGINIPIGNSAGATGFDLPSSAGIVTALSCDIIISGNLANTTGSIGFDAIQLELPTTNTTVLGSAYVDSYNISGDIIQGQRLIGSQIEANTITTEHLTVGVHGGNSLPNSSFEMANYTNTVPAGWTMLTNTTLSTESSFDGSRSICLSGTPITAASCNTFLKVETDVDYCVSYFYRTKTSSTANMAIVLYQYDSNKNILLFGGSQPYLISGSQNINNVEWTRQSLSFGPSTSYILQPTCAFVLLSIQKNSGEITFVDSVQMEEGSVPSLYSTGGLTQIDGGTIRTGRIQDNSGVGGAGGGKTYFDLDAGEIRTSNSNDNPTTQFTQINAGRVYTQNSTGDYTDIGAGSLKAYDNTAQKFTLIQSGELTNYNQATGDYSRLTDGLLEFYNASAGALTNYAVQIEYIDPSRLAMGLFTSFAHPYVGPQPIVIPIPVFFQSYSSANSASNQFVGYETRLLGNAGFYLDGFLYNGVPTSSGITSTTITDRFITLQSDGTAYNAADGLDQGHCTTDVNIIKVIIKCANASSANNKITNTIAARVCGGSTWNSATIIANYGTTITTKKNSTDWEYHTITFAGLSPGNKCIKIDWIAQDIAGSVNMEIDSVIYESKTVTGTLSGTNKCGALVIGRTI